MSMSQTTPKRQRLMASDIRMESSSQSSELLEAIMHNNVGVESMVHSELRVGALQSLGRALSALKTEGEDQTNSSFQFAMNDNSRQSKVSIEKSLENLLILPVTLSLRESCDGQRSDYSRRTYLYLQPMRLVNVTSLLATPTSIASRNTIHTLLSAVIVFNLALTMHLLALADSFTNGCMLGAKGRPAVVPNTTESTKLLLARAIHLYILAMELLHGAVRHQANDLMYIASLNNVAHAYCMYGDAEKSQECFKKLLSLMLLQTDALMMKRSVANLPQDLLEGCWSNLSHLVFPTGMAMQSAVAA